MDNTLQEPWESVKARLGKYSQWQDVQMQKDIRTVLERVEELERDRDAMVEEAVDEQTRSIKAALMDEQHDHALDCDMLRIAHADREWLLRKADAGGAEVERLRAEKTQIVGYVQRWQPAGSPPSTDALGLVRWIMGSVQEKLEAAETLVNSMAPDGVYEDEIAVARAALRGGGE